MVDDESGCVRGEARARPTPPLAALRRLLGAPYGAAGPRDCRRRTDPERTRRGLGATKPLLRALEARSHSRGRVRRRTLMKRGFTVALIGPDGAGKTTVAHELDQLLAIPVKYIY